MEKNCPTEWKNHGRVRFADCKGSYECVQKQCPFKMEFGVTNTTQFEKEGGEMICKGCGKVGDQEPLLLINVTEDYFLDVHIRLYKLDTRFFHSKIT